MGLNCLRKGRTEPLAQGRVGEQPLQLGRDGRRVLIGREQAEDAVDELFGDAVVGGGHHRETGGSGLGDDMRQPTPGDSHTSTSSPAMSRGACSGRRP